MHYRANFGDGTWTKGYSDLRDAKLAIWGRAGIVQYRSFIEVEVFRNKWETFIPSRASLNGQPITEVKP